ncbi:MAG: DNA primase [Actinomycetota bacterium]|nr:DNA primase [Actinomycetota bacterium]
MGIVDDDIVRVRETSDIVQVITQYTQLKRVGRRFQGLCPFHSERSGSFSVNAEEGLYYCFGCGAKGDVISFVREKEQLDFVGAVEWLANKFGVQLNYTDQSEGEDRKRRNHLHEVIDKAVEFYHKRLLTGPDAGVARGYLRQRGYDGEVVRRYRMGYAPDSWDSLAKHLRLSDRDWVDSGLGNLNRHGGQYDFFRNRVLFPIFDAQDRAMGFGGRVLPGSEDARKYMNSADSGVYSKSRVLYGLNWAKTSIVEADEVVVCEGYTDVVGYATAGVPRAVATCGTALTEDHVKLLSKFARRVVLSFDADAAGQNAAARFYEWERTHNLDVAVADLPDGVDPGDLARSDPERLRLAVAGARPFLAFRVHRALAGGDLTSAEGRARTAEAALAMVDEHPDALVRDQYVLEIAAHTRIEADLLRQQLAQGPRPQTGTRQGRARDDRGQDEPVQRGRPVGRRETLEYEALRLTVSRRDEMLPLLVPELFADERCAEAFHLISSFEATHDAVANADPEVADLLLRLSVEESALGPLDAASQLWRSFLDGQIRDIQARSKGSIDLDLAATSRQLAWCREHRDGLIDQSKQAAAVAALLRWLGQVPEEVY